MNRPPRPRLVNRLATGNPDWYRIENRAGTARVLIYDEIGYYGVSASDFVRELDALDVRKIDLRLNSPGGDVFDGMTIYNALRNHPAKVVATVDGLAASAASFIAMAADELLVEKTGTMMIHDAISIAIGNADAMRESADLLDKMSATIAGIYADRSGRSADDMRALMKAETWFNADEAVAAGLADRIAGAADDGDGNDAEDPSEESTDDKAAVAAKWDLSLFNFAGRDEAPAPVIPDPVTATPVATASPVPVPTVPVDLASVIRNALKEAQR